MLRLSLAKEPSPKTPDPPLEILNDTLQECRGLLYAHGSLFAHANNSKGLYRLTDTDADGTFDNVKEILHTEGEVGHGRNHLKLGPDGNLWIACGNNFVLPSPVSDTSPLKNYGTDQSLPNP